MRGFSCEILGMRDSGRLNYLPVDKSVSLGAGDEVYMPQTARRNIPPPDNTDISQNTMNLHFLPLLIFLTTASALPYDPLPNGKTCKTFSLVAGALPIGPPIYVGASSCCCESSMCAIVDFKDGISAWATLDKGFQGTWYLRDRDGQTGTGWLQVGMLGWGVKAGESCKV
ncbi:hypothetical protein K440DRAFT_185788 [Wilcoxina mikolae CBS 423.85]|nr:hypothetical protein K440DRAFT_185788 [Wilcoxina mikolae CBS 423.85]